MKIDIPPCGRFAADVEFRSDIEDGLNLGWTRQRAKQPFSRGQTVRWQMRSPPPPVADVCSNHWRQSYPLDYRRIPHGYSACGME